MVRALFFLLLISASLCAQDGTVSKKARRRLKADTTALLNDAYKIAAVQLTQTNFQDQRMTPLVFSGIGAALDLQGIRYSDKHYRDFQVKANYNVSRVDMSSNSYLHHSKFEFNLSYYWRLNKAHKEKIYLGGSFTNMMNVRYYPSLGNNALAFDFSSGWAPTVAWVKENFLKRKLIFQAKGGVNLVSFVSRYPEFVYTGSEDRIMFVGQFNRLFVEVGLSPKVRYSVENRYYFAYVFDAYAFSSAIDGNKIRSYVNGIKFAYWLKTK